MIRWDTMSSPIGTLLLTGTQEGLTGVYMETGGAATAAVQSAVRDTTRFTEVKQQLKEYFDGTRRAFDLTLLPEGTAFQKLVWDALRDIPYGTTISYQELANRIGAEKAVRAVGAANGANPIPIIIPCHRVIGADGSLTGYGGGIERKRWLLELESGQRPLPL
jgi:methylated-DNA-[protein]-cysteine S-methyltransferase